MARKEIHINDEIRKLVKALEKDIAVDEVILFGSYAKGSAKEDSDIDIAIISNHFGENPIKEKQLIYRTIIKEDIEPLFEVHTFSPNEIKKSNNHFISEIRSTGKKLWPVMTE